MTSISPSTVQFSALAKAQQAQAGSTQPLTFGCGASSDTVQFSGLRKKKKAADAGETSSKGLKAKLKSLPKIKLALSVGAIAGAVALGVTAVPVLLTGVLAPVSIAMAAGAALLGLGGLFGLVRSFRGSTKPEAQPKQQPIVFENKAESQEMQAFDFDSVDLLLPVPGLAVTEADRALENELRILVKKELEDLDESTPDRDFMAGVFVDLINIRVALARVENAQETMAPELAEALESEIRLMFKKLGNIYVEQYAGEETVENLAKQFNKLSELAKNLIQEAALSVMDDEPEDAEGEAVVSPVAEPAVDTLLSNAVTAPKQAGRVLPKAELPLVDGPRVRVSSLEVKQGSRVLSTQEVIDLINDEVVKDYSNVERVTSSADLINRAVLNKLKENADYEVKITKAAKSSEPPEERKVGLVLH